MKKSLKLLVLPAAMVLVAGSTTSCTPSLKEVAMITDVGDIDDGSFNQSCWEGVKSYCVDHNLSYGYYRPFADSDFARRCAIKQAVAKGAKIVILPGYKFADTATYASTNEQYKDVKFVLIDEFALPKGESETRENLICIKFDFAYSGWLAGYAVAKDYFTVDYEKDGKLHDQYGFGFIGGNCFSSVYPFGYGFIEGVIYAAGEFTDTDKHPGCNTPLINFKTNYAGVFQQDDLVCANVKGWLSNEKEPIQCVFPCGGKLYQSITEAVNYYNDHNLPGNLRNFKDQEAPREAARWIGVDGNQYELLKDKNENDRRSIYTSALKDLGHAVQVCIEAYKDGDDSWSTLRHRQGEEDTGCFKIGLGEENIKLKEEESHDYVGIPLDTKPGSKVLKSFNKVTNEEVEENTDYLAMERIKIYTGETPDYGDKGGDFKSIASQAFKDDEKINTYSEDDITYKYKYTNYTIE